MGPGLDKTTQDHTQDEFTSISKVAEVLESPTLELDPGRKFIDIHAKYLNGQNLYSQPYYRTFPKRQRTAPNRATSSKSHWKDTIDSPSMVQRPQTHRLLLCPFQHSALSQIHDKISERL